MTAASRTPLAEKFRRVRQALPMIALAAFFVGALLLFYLREPPQPSIS